MQFRDYWKTYAPEATRDKAKKLYQQYLEVEKVSTDLNVKEDMISNQCVTVSTLGWTFAPLPAAIPCNVAECNTSYECKTNKQKGNNPMYVDNDKHIESSKINYLNDRLNNSFSKKEETLPAVFNLDTPKVPDTAEKLVEAITSGNYTIKPKAERNVYDRVTNQIVWRSPSIVPDQAGYDVARETLFDLRQTAKDTIAVGTPADALTAIKAIDAFVPVTPAPAAVTA